MGLTKEQIQSAVSEYGDNERDTGNVSVQIALLTIRIQQMTGHLQQNKKDHHGRRGLLKMVGQRKRLLRYLESKNIAQFRALKKKLNIR